MIASKLPLKASGIAIISAYSVPSSPANPEKVTKMIPTWFLMAPPTSTCLDRH